jgi:ribosomal-protein-alanine N-acetyltransferase
MASLVQPPAVSILPGGAADAADVERLSATAFDPGFREAWTARQLLQVLEAPGGWLLLARTGPDKISGFTLLRMAGDEAELLLCATCESVRRQGIARRLVEAALVSARARGALRMFLEVRESNHAARALYERCGFSQIGIRPGYYTSVKGERLAALTMARLLF